MTSPDPLRPERWVKASASNDAGACIELRRPIELVEVRDSKAGDSGPILSLRPAVFGAWLERAKAGQLDRLSARRLPGTTSG